MRSEESPVSDRTINVSCYSAKSERKMPSLEPPGTSRVPQHKKPGPRPNLLSWEAVTPSSESQAWGLLRT